MIKEITVKSVNAREIIDSRGNPTVEARVVLSDGSEGKACAPSGASTGEYKAHELRDGDEGRYGGKGVQKAVSNIERIIAPSLVGRSVYNQEENDSMMIKLDGSINKSALGANAMLSVSLACARAAANSLRIPLFRYIGGLNSVRLPVPMMNILNGGRHASNNIDIQEFMIVPTGAGSFSEALRICCEVYHTLGALLVKHGLSACVGDEGGYAPDLGSEEEALDYICEAIEKAGYEEDDIRVAIDAAASEWADESGKCYKMPKTGKMMTTPELIRYWQKLSMDYPIISMEDPLGENDLEGWSEITKVLGEEILLVGDDLFATNVKRLSDGIERSAANAILIKPNQIGTLSETLMTVRAASEAGYAYVISHRSGETPDTTIADLSVALNSPFIKTGAPARGERTAKYNRLTEIETLLGQGSVYGS